MSRQRVSQFIFIILAFVTVTAVYAGPVATNIRSLRAQAMESFARGQVDAAINYLEDALRLSAKTYGSRATYISDIYYDMGTMSLAASRYPKAEEYLKQAIALNPNTVNAKIKLAELMQLRGHSEEARKLANQILQKHKNSMAAHEILVKSYQEEGNYAKATRESFYISEISQGRIPKIASVAPAALPASIVAPDKNEEAAASEKKESADTKAESNKTTNSKSTAASKPAINSSKTNGAAKAVPVDPVKQMQEAYKKMEEEKKRSKAKRESNKQKNKPAKLKVLKPRKAVETEAVPEEEAAPEAEKSASEPTEESKPVKAPAVKAKAQSIRGRSRGGLVPPPPPVIPMFPGAFAPPEAPVKKAKKVKEPVEKAAEAKEEKAPAKPSAGEDTDFLLDWAAVKHKKK